MKFTKPETLSARNFSYLCPYTLGFDEPYLYKRCKKNHVDMAPMSHMLLSGEGPRLSEKTLQSNAYGHNEMATIELPGVFHCDLMGAIKKAHTLESYSLDACAQQFLPDDQRKADLKPQEMFDCWKTNDVGTLLDYCCQDVFVTYMLAEKLSILPSMIESAAISWVTPTMVASRGQQIRVYSCIKREIYSRKAALFLRDTKDDVPLEGGYQGATVLTPCAGFYPRSIISLDFASLYPTIMRQYNLSNETMSDTLMDDPRFYKHDDGCGFIKTSHHLGVLPAILGQLALARKGYKKTMQRFEKLAHEAVEGSKERADFLFGEKVFNAKQLAAKTSMNSVYGFCGVQNHGGVVKEHPRVVKDH